MKYVLVLSLVMISVLGADWQRVVGSSDAPVVPDKKVMKSDSLGVYIRTTVFGFTEDDTTIDNKTFKRIELPGEFVQQAYQDTALAGKPQVPYVRLLIAVPDSAEFDIEVKTYGSTQFDDYLVYPMPLVVFEDTADIVYYTEIYTYDTAFYQQDTLYPGKFYEINNDGHWRDQRVLEVFLYPVQFNPQNELVYFYDLFDLEIMYSGTVVENENGMGPFEEIGRETLLNYPGIDHEPESVPEPAYRYYTDLRDTTNVADYLIVMGTEFYYNETASYWIEQFAQWRVDHNLFNVGLVKMEDVYADSNWPIADPDSPHVSLREFLVYAYDHWRAPATPDGHFAYCLFVGDWDYVPTEFYKWPGDERFFCAREGYFRNMDPSPLDRWDDIMLGRWPVKETEVEDLVTICQKTLNYEQYPNTSIWRRRGLLIAGPHGPEWIVDRALPYFTDIDYDTFTVWWSDFDAVDPEPFLDTIHALLNAGEIMAAWYGHGTFDYWTAVPWTLGYSTAYAETLCNGDMLPVVLSYACMTATFQWDHPYYNGLSSIPDSERICLGECFLFNPDGGAVAWYGGASLLLMSSYNATPMERVLRSQQWILGKALINAVPPLGGGKDYCLLGDPALDLGDYTAYPNLPDLVVRPRGIDISVLAPYPYPTSGDSIPMRAKVLNIGGATAYDVDVGFEVVSEQVIASETVLVDMIRPRDSVVVTAYWNTGATHQNYYGEIGDCDFIVTIDPDSEITESWEGNNQSSTNRKVALYPNEQYWPKYVIGWTQPALGNLDGAGSTEIVYASHDSVYVFDPAGHSVSGWPQYFKGVSGLVIGDIVDDSTLEVIAVSSESIKVFDYQGDVLPGWPVQIPYYNNWYRIMSLPALGVISDSANGYPEIVAPIVSCRHPNGAIDSVKVLVYNNGGQEIYEFSSSKSAHNQQIGLAIEDMVSTGNDEIVISYYVEPDNARTEIFNKNGSVRVCEWGNSDMTPALADLGTDGYAEVIVGGRDGRIIAYDVADSTELWEDSTEGAIYSSPAVGDIHTGTQYPGVEITFGNDASWVHLREKEQGNLLPLWPVQVNPSGAVQASPAITNINADKYPDVIVGANNNYIYAFEYNTDPIAPYPLPLFGKPKSPLIGDIDGDKLSEIVIASFDGYLHVWENQASEVVAYSLEWPQFHHDYQRTGLYNWVRGLRGGDANPKEFSTATTISFTLKDNLNTQMKVYDVEGNLVRNLVSQTLPAGTYNPVWYGNNNNFALLPNGLYFIEIRVNNESKITIVEINR